MSPRFGVAVTTHNRPDQLHATITALLTHCPEGTPIVVVDDGSTEPAQRYAGVRDYIRNDCAHGIPTAKNQCITALMDRDVEHLFLLDDDTRPTRHHWWLPYVEGEEPYYTYCWTHFAHNGQPVPKMSQIYRDTKLVAYTWSMGCLQYVHSDVVKEVGGLNPVFGMGFEEHGEWAQRIHNAGFTSFVHQDHPGTTGFIYAGDEHCAVERTFGNLSRAKRARMIERNTRLRLERIQSREFVDYRG